MDATGIEGVNAEVGRLSERIWPQARRAREAALRSRPSTERNEASGQRRRSNRALFYRGQYLVRVVRSPHGLVLGQGAEAMPGPGIEALDRAGGLLPGGGDLLERIAMEAPEADHLGLLLMELTEDGLDPVPADQLRLHAAGMARRDLRLPGPLLALLGREVDGGDGAPLVVVGDQVL